MYVIYQINIKHKIEKFRILWNGRDQLGIFLCFSYVNFSSLTHTYFEVKNTNIQVRERHIHARNMQIIREKETYKRFISLS